MSRQPRLTWRSAALEPDSGLSWRARFAAAVYCEFANGMGVLDPAPSPETIAERMGVALATAHRARRELEQAGWLTVERRPGRPSRMVLHTGEPLHHRQGSGDATPVQTPVQTPVSTPVPETPEPENQKNQRTRGAPKDDSFTAVLARVAARSRGEDP